MIGLVTKFKSDEKLLRRLITLCVVIVRYIEGLNSNSDSISDWRKNLSAKEEQCNLSDQQKARLPAHWFANGVGRDGDVVKAMWKLRDLLMQDTLRMSQNEFQ